MKVNELIAQARETVAGSTPRYIDINVAAENARQGIEDMAFSRVGQAMEQAILGAQSVLKSTCEEYIEALYVDDDIKIAIRSDKAYLEQGYAPREMMEDLLSSPKAKISADGDRYVKVPIGGKPTKDIRTVIGKKASDLFTKGSGKASNTTLADMTKSMQNLSNQAPPVLDGPSKLEFRVVSEKQDQSWKYKPEQPWVHPGFSGVNQLDAINAQLEADMKQDAMYLVKAEVDKMRR